MTQAIKAALAAMGMVAAMAAQAGSYVGDGQLQTQCLIATASGPVVSTVGAQLDFVEAQILAGQFKNARDQSNMLGKLGEAANKSRAKKWADASTKLEDISDQADALAGAAKPKLASAGGITAAAGFAQECVSATF